MLEPSLACAEMLKYVALPGETALQTLLPFQHGSLALVSIRAWLPLTCYVLVDGDLHVHCQASGYRSGKSGVGNMQRLVVQNLDRKCKGGFV